MVCFHQSMSRWGNEEPGNYTHIIPLPRDYFIYAQFGTNFKFWGHNDYIFLFVLLVISTIRMVSTVSSLASKHFCSFAHCPYHTRSLIVVAYHSNTHCPHHINLQEFVWLTLFLSFGLWWAHHHHPWVVWRELMFLWIIWGWWGGPPPSLMVSLVIVATMFNNIIFRKV